MRILFLTRSVVLSGGIENVMTAKASWMAGQGHQVLFLTYEQGMHPFSFPLNEHVVHEDLECRYFTIYRKNAFVRPYYMLQMFRMFRRRLKEKIDAFKPDLLVIPHNISEYLPVITSMNQYVPIVFECHSTHVGLFQSGGSLAGKIKQHRLIPHIRRCSLVVSLTEADANFWRKYCKRVEALPNPLNCYLEALPKAVKNKGCIICAARLHQIKRIDRLIEAFALICEKYPDWYIDIYGEGEEKDALSELIHRKNLQQRVFIKSPVSYIYSKYLTSEFLVLSSDSESFSLVLVEAMSCGIPVVAVDCPYGPASIINNGKTGLLASPTPSSLAEKMEWMITHEEERRAMGIAARQAAARYQKEVVMKEWEKVYRTVF